MNATSTGRISEEVRNIISYEWKVPNFLEIMQKVEVCIKSPKFSFLDTEWQLSVHPDVPTNPKWIGLFLTKFESVHERRVACHFGIRDGDGNDYESFSSNFHLRCQEDILGRMRFVGKSSLHCEYVSPKGIVTFFCILHSKAHESKEIASKIKHSEGAEKVIDDLKGLLLSGDASDLTLNVKRRKFRVHSAILAARSSVFAAMMRHDMKENRSRIIDIEDCEPDAFQEYLDYIYSGETENFSTDTVCALFHIADKYDAGAVKTRCIQFIMDNLSVEVFCDALSLSLRYNESELLKKVTTYFAQNMKKILITADWLSFMKENPVEANEMHIKATDHLFFIS